MTSQPGRAASGWQEPDSSVLPAYSAGILGLGMHVPDRVLSNHDLARMVDTSDEWISSRTGIRERRVTDEGTATSDLAVVAAQQALDDAGIRADQIDLILCATTSGDYVWPSTACVIQERIGASKAAAMDVCAACSGFCYGLATAAAFLRAGDVERVLLIGADTLTKQLNWSDRSTCILFGDGAGAVVLGRCAAGTGVIASSLGADGKGLTSVWIPAGGSRSRATAQTIENRETCIAMNGKEVYRFAVQIVPDMIERALSAACLRVKDIDLLVLHQANIRIIHAVAERLRLPPEKLVINLDRYGNTSAASVPMALAETCAAGRLRRGDVVVTAGFGAGLTWAANVIRWNLE